MAKRIGIYSGTFDPVHHGHMAFIDDAMKKADLEKVVVLPEPQPRRRQRVSDIKHREEMLHLATAHHDRIDVVVPPHQQFTVAETLPWLKQQYPDSELHFLIGSDFLNHLEEWPDVRDLLQAVNFIIAARDSHDRVSTAYQTNRISKNLGQPFKHKIISSRLPHISSTGVRHALNHGFDPLVPDIVADYAKQNHLYI